MSRTAKIALKMTCGLAARPVARGRTHCLAWTAVLAALVLCVFSGFAAAAETSENGEAPPLATQGQEKKSFTDRMEDIEIRVEETHEQLEQDILDQIMRLDTKFGNVQKDPRRQTSYVFRLRNGIRLEEKGRVRPDITLRANIVLPKISEKLRLVISGENKVDTLSPALPDDPGNPGFDRTTLATARLVNTEFRYELIRKTDWYLFAGAGVRIALPLEPFVRSRFQYTHRFNSFFLLHLGETVFVKYNDGVGETTEVNLERLLNERTLLRLANSATLSQEFTGLEWGSELSWIRALSAKSALTVTAGMYGNSAPATVVSNYRLLTCYRQNFLRDWLFFEVEPEVSWPRNVDSTHPRKVALTFRLEVLFDKASGS
jgi:hypothetical protein